MEEIQRAIGRIEGKLDNLTNQIVKHFEEDDGRFSSAFKQISAIDRKLAWLWGVGAAILALISFYTSWFKFK